MAKLTPQERAARERREAGRWDALKERGETIQREARRVEAQKAKEGGVQQKQGEGHGQGMRM